MAKIISISLIVVPVAAAMVSAQTNSPPVATTAITVQVSNATPGGNSAAGAVVVLEAFSADARVGIWKQQADAEGKAVFSDVPNDPGLVVRAACDHAGIHFQSEVLSLEAVAGDEPLAIRIYDVTADTSSLKVTTHHIIIKRLPEALLVSEFLQLINSADQVVKPESAGTGERPRVLTMSLPAGYENFKSGSYFVADALIFDETSFYDTMSIAPGGYNIEFTYTLPLESSVREFRKSFTLPTEKTILFLVLPEAQPKGLGPRGGQLPLPDGILGDYYRLGPQEVGGSIAFQLTGFEMSRPDKSLWIVLPVVFLVVFIIALWRLRQSRAAARRESQNRNLPNASV